MELALDIYQTIRDFLERGGAVLLTIAGVILTMWFLILRRWIYLGNDYHEDVSTVLESWAACARCGSEHTNTIRAQSMAAIWARLYAGIPTIRTLATICPLLGLLGTVTGMIMVFDMMSLAQASSPRIVAAGVSTAMVTTMAGMVGALSGIFPAALLGRRARSRLNALATAEDAQLFEAQQPVAPRRATRIKHALPPVVALAITVGLLFGMEQMILIGRAVMSEDARNFRVDFIRMPRERVVEQRVRKPDRPDAPQEQPDARPEPASAEEFAAGNALAIAAPRTDLQFGGIATGRAARGFAGVQDGEYLPIVKVAPIYPRQAEIRGLEGWVIVRFTVTENGSVRDIEVVQSSDPIFEDAAVAAAEKFRYRPRVVDGLPIQVQGVFNRISFVLERPQTD